MKTSTKTKTQPNARETACRLVRAIRQNVVAFWDTKVSTYEEFHAVQQTLWREAELNREVREMVCAMLRGEMIP